MLVDGSLRNAHWYLEYFKNLREKFPVIKIGILHVTARPETVLLRARNRAQVTGRHVPEETILESMRKIPVSALLSLTLSWTGSLYRAELYTLPCRNLWLCCRGTRSLWRPS